MHFEDFLQAFKPLLAIVGGQVTAIKLKSFLAHNILKLLKAKKYATPTSGAFFSIIDFRNNVRFLPATATYGKALSVVLVHIGVQYVCVTNFLSLTS